MLNLIKFRPDLANSDSFGVSPYHKRPSPHDSGNPPHGSDCKTDSPYTCLLGFYSNINRSDKNFSFKGE